MDTLLAVVSREPERPSAIVRGVDRDLETISLKCLDKDPDRRYDSAAALADDLARWLRGEPILARPAGKLERAMKWAKRHPAVAALATALLAVVVVAFVLVTWKWHEAIRQSEIATKASQAALRESARATEASKAATLASEEATRRADAEAKAKNQARASLEQERQVAFTAQLWRAAALSDRDPGLALWELDNPQLCPPERRDFAWRYYRQLNQRLVRRGPSYEAGLNDVAVSSDGSLIAVALENGDFHLWDVTSGKAGVILPGHGRKLPNWRGPGENRSPADDSDVSEPGGVKGMAFSPDNKLLATGGLDGLVKLWEMPSGKLLATLKWEIPDGPPRIVMSLAFSSDGKKLAVGGGVFDPVKARAKNADVDGRFRMPVVWVWDIASHKGKLLTSTPRLTGKWIDDSGVCSMAFAPGDKTLAIGLTRESSVVIVDAQTGQEQHRYHPEAGWIGGIAFSPDGKLLAYGNDSNNVFVCDAATTKIPRRLYGHFGHISSVVFTHDGGVITGAYDATVRVWDAASGQPRLVLRCTSAVQQLRLLPGEKQLLVCTTNDAQTWSLHSDPELATLSAQKEKNWWYGASSIDFNAPGTLLAAAGQDEVVRVWDVATRTVARDLAGHKARTTAVAFGPADGDLLATGGEDHQVLLWHLHGANPLQPVVLAGHTRTVTCLAVTPDGAIVASGSHDGTVRLWDARAGKCLDTLATGQGQVHCLALSDDGRRLVTGGDLGSMRVWNLAERKLIQRPPAQFPAGGPIEQLAVTRDGQTLASLQSGLVTLHDLGGDGQAPMRPIASGAAAVAFTPDGKSLAVGSGDRVTRLYDVASGAYRGELPGHSQQVVALAFNRDATLLATASRGYLRWNHGGEVKLWAAPFPEPNAR